MTRRALAQLVLLGLVWCALATPLLRAALESNLVGHALVQIPALLLLGVAAAGIGEGALRPRPATAARYALAGLLAFLFVAAFWALPLSLDRAVRVPLFAGAKFVSLPLAGFALATAWPHLAPLLRAFLEAQAYSMGLFMAWFYATVPERLCTSYLASEQPLLALGWLTLTAALAATRAVHLLLCDDTALARPARRDVACSL